MEKLGNDHSMISIASLGTQENTNWRQCWQAHDNYYECIDQQINDGKGKSYFLIINLRSQQIQMHEPRLYV